MEVLTGREVLRLAVDRTMLHTRVGKTKSGADVASRPYYRAQYKGITFTVGQEFIDALDKGQVAEISLNTGEREIDDALNPGVKVKIPSLSFGNYITKAAYLGAVGFESELKAIEHPELNKIVINDDQLAQLQALLVAPKA